MIRFLSAFAAMMAIATAAHGQVLDPNLLQAPVDGSVASWIIRTFGLLTVLSVAPGILIMVTSFPRFIIAFAILRAGMGLATTPANMILVSLSLFMTFYVMAPTFDRAWERGVSPLLENQVSEEEAIQLIADPFASSCSSTPVPRISTCSSTLPPSVVRRPKRKARSTCGFWFPPS
jgi:flagellar biosynthetic protein FliP